MYGNRLHDVIISDMPMWFLHKGITSVSFLGSKFFPLKGSPSDKGSKNENG